MSILGSEAAKEAVRRAAQPQRTGRVSHLVGTSMSIEGVEAAVSDAVYITRRDGTVLPAEVVAINGGRLTCMPLGRLDGVQYGNRVSTSGRPLGIKVGASLLGRVLDGLGNPIDNKPPLSDVEEVGVNSEPPHPLLRDFVNEQLPLGVRAIDTMIPCGRGQRLGVFAGSGVGKSSLLSMIVRGTAADVCVLALVGERGREVREFLERDLQSLGLARSVVVVATSDQPALVRIRSAFTATRIAEWFRDQGLNVVLMMDSLTRFAMAQREVGLAAGEPPTQRGYPPSVFGLLPKLLERAGAAERGSITGIYTVLVEGDDMNEPIADATRSILDGHIRLSRQLAEANHYPAIDILGSISRVESSIVPAQRRHLTTMLRQLMAEYNDKRDLVEIGAYARGSNALVDRAIDLREGINRFLCQSITDHAILDESWAMLHALVGAGTDEATNSAA